MGFVLHKNIINYVTVYIPDWKRFPELIWLNDNHTAPGLFLGASLLYFWGIEAFYWGFVLSTVLLWHGTFFINSLAHVYGTRRYETKDTSKNNFWLAIITLGEGWHNNHHMYMSSANQGFFWYELDVSYLVLRFLAVLGIVSQLREPPLESLNEKLIVNK